eukprot:2912720-Pyramimonas_sp.AAC.1
MAVLPQCNWRPYLEVSSSRSLTMRETSVELVPIDNVTRTAQVRESVCQIVRQYAIVLASAPLVQLPPTSLQNLKY